MKFSFRKRTLTHAISPQARSQVSRFGRKLSFMREIFCFLSFVLNYFFLGTTKFRSTASECPQTRVATGVWSNQYSTYLRVVIHQKISDRKRFKQPSSKIGILAWDQQTFARNEQLSKQRQVWSTLLRRKTYSSRKYFRKVQPPTEIPNASHAKRLRINNSI